MEKKLFGVTTENWETIVCEMIYTKKLQPLSVFLMHRSALYDLYNLRYYLKQYAGSRIFHPRHYR